MRIEEVDKLYFSEYIMRLEAATNIFNGYRLGKFEMKSSFDQHSKFLKEVELFKRQGRLN